MKTVIDGPDKDFAVPSGVVIKSVDANTGIETGSGSSKSTKEVFLPGTGPKRASGDVDDLGL